jgi:hypothetical protein
VGISGENLEKSLRQRKRQKPKAERSTLLGIRRMAVRKRKSAKKKPIKQEAVNIAWEKENESNLNKRWQIQNDRKRWSY